MPRKRRERWDRDAWICVCGNTPCGAGFYECDSGGRHVEPVEGQWDGRLYLCNGCGVIIDGATLTVMGRATPPHELETFFVSR